ncbi:MAG: HAMP domain-containing sensor histidine kinase [Bacteroidota bacterium]
MESPISELNFILSALFAVGMGYFLATTKRKKLTIAHVVEHVPSWLQSLAPSKAHPLVKIYPYQRHQEDPIPMARPEATGGPPRLLRLDRAQQVAQYREQIDQLTERERELTRQRDQLAVVLHDIQSQQNSLLEERKLAALDRLKAGMAHELNNALNVVGGVIGPLKDDFAELKRSIDESDRSEAIQEIEDLLEALSDSSDRARISAAKFLDLLPKNSKHQWQVYDLSDLLRKKLDWLKISYPEIHFDFQIAQGCTVSGDFSELLLVVHHLLINAIEASHRQLKPKIGLSIQEAQGQLIIVATDNGVGIPDSLKDKIFEPFYTTKNSNKAVGLGLFAIHGLITQMHGSIEVNDNIEEGGSVFRVLIPVNPMKETDR